MPGIVCGVVFLAGCDPGAPTARYAFDPIGLTHETLYEGAPLARPVAIALRSSRLAVLDLEGRHSLHVFDPESRRLLASIGDVASEPGGLVQAIRFLPDRTGRTWVFDNGSGDLTRVDLHRLTGTEWEREVVPLGFSEETGYALDLVWTDRGELFMEGLFPNGRFSLVDPTDGRFRYVGAVPVLPTAGGRVDRRAFVVELAASPDLARIAAASWWRSEIEILDSGGERVARADTPIEVQPVLVDNPRTGTRVPGPESARAYTDVVTSDRYIYALFSGRTAERYARIQDLGRDIHVFDWEGALVTVLRMDRDAVSLAVDEESGYLYTVDLNPTPAILRYRLPNLP